MMKSGLLNLTIVIFLIALTACGSKDTQTTGSPSGSSDAPAQQLTLIATKFKFDQTEYRVKKGEPVKITLENKDGTHGVEIKEFHVSLTGGKSAVFTPDKAGKYDIVCSIFCGSGHANMKSTLIVE